MSILTGWGTEPGETIIRPRIWPRVQISRFRDSKLHHFMNERYLDRIRWRFQKSTPYGMLSVYPLELRGLSRAEILTHNVEISGPAVAAISLS